MNAGCYGAETKDVLVSAWGFNRAGERHYLSAADFGFTYRHNALPDGEMIWVEALFQGRPDDAEAVRFRMAEITARREASQPIREKTGGSTFQNPSGTSAWKLVDAAGWRGKPFGGAMFSPLHANFMINTGTAAAADTIEGLGEAVRAERQEPRPASSWTGRSSASGVRDDADPGPATRMPAIDEAKPLQGLADLGGGQDRRPGPGRTGCAAFAPSSTWPPASEPKAARHRPSSPRTLAVLDQPFDDDLKLETKRETDRLAAARRRVEAGIERLFREPDVVAYGEETANQAYARFDRAVARHQAAAGEASLIVATHRHRPLRPSGPWPVALGAPWTRHAAGWRRLSLPSAVVDADPGDRRDGRSSPPTAEPPRTWRPPRCACFSPPWRRRLIFRAER